MRDFVLAGGWLVCGIACLPDLREYVNRARET